VRQHGHLPVRAGERLGITMQPGKFHVFAADGQALRA